MSQKSFIQFDALSFFFPNVWQKPDGGWSCDLNVTPLSLPLSEVAICQYGSLVLPLWAVWKIHQAFPLESVRIREQALQWPHTRHIFYQSTLSSANVEFRRTQNHCRRQFASVLQVFGAAQAYRCTHTGISSPELLKTDGRYPFHCRLFTLMVWDLTFTACECESSWLSPVRYLRAGQRPLSCLPLSTLHFLLSGSPEHRGRAGIGQNDRNTWADN